ncbi:hypothetical protein Adi01nite_50500 [Amorphoplanes digitatis]|nr:hypothetical protein Adi01nite_50500 [Actinoplanes digitatis]
MLLQKGANAIARFPVRASEYSQAGGLPVGLIRPTPPQPEPAIEDTGITGATVPAASSKSDHRPTGQYRPDLRDPRPNPLSPPRQAT